jgi:Flp pilus assembly pilin Flp
LVIPGGSRSFRGASAVSLPPFNRLKALLERGMVARCTRDEHSNMTRLSVLRFARRETGQTMAEYSVVLAVITPAIVAVLVLYSDAMVNAFQSVVDAIS